jgi:prepilin-type N-terminal cleavage/methylation domain-containing protein
MQKYLPQKILRKRRGFSLIEFAIVVGVGAIVAGGIWAVAGNAWESVRRDQQLQVISKTVDYMRNRYAGQEGVPSLGWRVISQQLALQGTMPQEMVRRGAGCVNGAAPNIICTDTAWGPDQADVVSVLFGSYRICDWILNPLQTACSPVGGAGDPAQYFGVEMHNLSFPNCLWLATNGTAQTGPRGLQRVRIQTTDFTTFPIPVATARVACAAAPALKVIRFVYRLRVPTG